MEGVFEFPLLLIQFHYSVLLMFLIKNLIIIIILLPFRVRYNFLIKYRKCCGIMF